LTGLLAPLIYGPVPPGMMVLLWIGTVPIVLLFSVVIAAPLLAVAMTRIGSRLLIALGAIFVAAFLSCALVLYLTAPDASSVGATVYATNGSLTLAGWSDLLLRSLIMGGLSLPGGYLWWLASHRPLEPLHDA